MVSYPLLEVIKAGLVKCGDYVLASIGGLLLALPHVGVVPVAAAQRAEENAHIAFWLLVVGLGIRLGRLLTYLEGEAVKLSRDIARKRKLKKLLEVIPEDEKKLLDRFRKTQAGELVLYPGDKAVCALVHKGLLIDKGPVSTHSSIEYAYALHPFVLEYLYREGKGGAAVR